MSLFERMYLLFVPIRDKTIQPYLKEQPVQETGKPKDPGSKGTSADPENKTIIVDRSNRAAKFGLPKDPA